MPRRITVSAACEKLACPTSWSSAASRRICRATARGRSSNPETVRKVLSSSSPSLRARWSNATVATSITPRQCSNRVCVAPGYTNSVSANCRIKRSRWNTGWSMMRRSFCENRNEPMDRTPDSVVWMIVRRQIVRLSETCHRAPLCRSGSPTSQHSTRRKSEDTSATPQRVARRRAAGPRLHRPLVSRAHRVECPPCGARPLHPSSEAQTVVVADDDLQRDTAARYQDRLRVAASPGPVRRAAGAPK